MPAGAPRFDEAALGGDPIAAFRDWFAAAVEAGLPLAEAAALATASAGGAPSARIVLLKGVDDRGRFLFFTNYESRKGRELAENPRAALVFHWQPLGRQVRVEGAVTRVSPEESEAYFQTRPRGSRIGAWASRQSEPVADRDELERAVREVDERHPDDDVPLPPFWGGFRIEPHTIEFWQHGDDRLHDRIRFRREAGQWQRARLSP